MCLFSSLFFVDAIKSLNRTVRVLVTIRTCLIPSLDWRLGMRLEACYEIVQYVQHKCDISDPHSVYGMSDPHPLWHV